MKISRKDTIEIENSVIYRVPLFTCDYLADELVEDGLNIDEIKFRVYETIETKFDISIVERAVLNCVPDAKPIPNEKNQILFCNDCPEKKAVYLKVFTEDKQNKVFRLVGGSSGLQFKEVINEK